MILKGAQRGHAKKLAVHLLNSKENDHVEVHSVIGFLSNDVTMAFKEVQAIAKGTKCSQPFFSVALNPPANVTVTIEDFEKAIAKIEDMHGLTGQPRIVIFHEKEGRRHAHAVWSRIDAQSMKAIELPFFKNKLRHVSKELFFEHQWRMPKGLVDSEARNPTNVTLTEWQQAKRLSKNAIDEKMLIRECWASSDTPSIFQAALKGRGYTLAQGNRRSHVVVSHDGQIFALARCIGLKTKQVRERLGDAAQFPDVETVLEENRLAITAQFSRLAKEARTTISADRHTLHAKRAAMIEAHRIERSKLLEGQKRRWEQEAQERQNRFKTGLGALWQRMTGAYRYIQQENQIAVYEALKRDSAQKQSMVTAQLAERRSLERQRTQMRRNSLGLISEMKFDREKLLEKISQSRSEAITTRRSVKRLELDHEISPSMK